MDGLPTFADATEAAGEVADSVRDHGRTLLPWLPDPPACPACGALMYAGETFDPRQATYVNCWTCRNCDAPDRYRDDPDVDAPAPPQRGAPALREVFQRE